MSCPAPVEVSLRALHKHYGEGQLALGGIDFHAAPGDFISIIGPSGCGKTTWLRLLAGLSEPSGGSLQINGKAPSEAAHELSFVFQDSTLLPWLKVRQNVEILLKLRGIEPQQRQKRCEEVLSLVRLSEFAERYPRQLSGGQKMRVSLARALSISPGLLLLDEPFGALDEMTREHLNEELLAIRESETWTAFFVTHSVAEAVFLSNRVVIMSTHPGRIHRQVAVPLSYPRTADTRLSAEYQALVAQVSRELRSVESDSP